MVTGALAELGDGDLLLADVGEIQGLPAVDFDAQDVSQIGLEEIADALGR